MEKKLYYIHNGRYLGDALVWWGPNMGGYTSDIEKAGKYSAEKAREICSNKSRDEVAYECEAVERCVIKVVHPGSGFKETKLI